jgi:acetate kinase
MSGNGVNKINMSKIIVVNSGSVSKKYALYEDENLLVSFHFENDTEKFVLHKIKDRKFDEETIISESDFEQAFDYTVDFLLEHSYIKNDSEIDAVVFRVVAPGTYFTFDRVIDDEFLEKLSETREQSPLHVTKMFNEFNQVSDRLKKVKMIAVSDSRFHKTIPDFAAVYALPQNIREELDLKKFGYHGISLSSVVEKIKKDKKTIPEKIIICHLGGGSSITAIKNGESIDTTMGYSPIEGLPMSSRVGHVDPGIIIEMADKLDLELSEIRDIFYYKSGLKGLSNGYDDMRVLLKRKQQGDKNAILALDNFIYNIQKTIGGYYALLGGLDLLVFTGTIGERSFPVRKLICKKLSSLNIEINEKNNDLLDGEGYINTPGSPVSVEVIYTDENKEMAIRASDLI